MSMLTRQLGLKRQPKGKAEVTRSTSPETVAERAEHARAVERSATVRQDKERSIDFEKAHLLRFIELTQC